MFGKKHSDNGEKIYRYSIRKYHFGAASVAVAALMFFANGVQAQAPAVSPVTASDVVAGPSGNSDGDPQDSDEESPEKTAVVEQPVELKSEGESSAPEAKTEEGSQEESEAEVKSSQPDTKIDDKEEAPQVAKEKEQEESAPVADTSAAKSAQRSLEALLPNLTLDSMKALHTEVEEALAKAKAVLENPKATQAQVDEQVKLMEDLTRRVREALSPQVPTPPVLEKAGLTNTRLATPEGAVLTPKEAVTKVLEKNPVASTNGEVRTPSTKLSKSEVSDNQNKEKLKTISKDLSAYLIQANKITRPETKKLLEGVEEIVKSIEASVLQPQLTPAEIEELLKKGKQAEKKLALALTRENSGKRDLLNHKPMKTGSDFRASSATEDLNTIRAYIAKGGTVTTKTGYTFTLPKETYLYSMNRSTNPNYPINNRPQANVGEALEEANITVKKDDRDTTGRTFIWEVTFNSSNQSHQNAYYWFTLPKGHTIGELLAATRTSKGNRSYGTSNFDAEWGGKIKDHLSVNKAVFGSAKNYHFDDTVDSITDLTNVNFIAGSKQNAANNEENRFKADGRGFYYLGALYKPGGFLKDGNNGVISDSVIDKAERNLKGLKDNAEKLYLVKYDGSGPIRLKYTTTTDNKYAPLYYAAGMRSYEYSAAKHYFMARGLQEKPNAPVISDNNVGTVTVKPNTEKADKVEINYVGSDTSAKKATITRNAQNGTWSSDDSGIEVSGTSFIVKPSAVKVGTQVKAKSWFGNSDPSDEATGNILRRTDKPTVTAKEDGSVIVRPSANATHLTISYTDETSKQNKTITADKTGDSWGVKGDSAITINRNSGEVTIPANSVADSTKVEAQAKAPGEALSEKAEDTARAQDRTAPTIRVRKNGTSTWLTPKDGVVTVVAIPNSSGEVNLDVHIEDNSGGSGYTFNSRPSDSQTAKYEGTGYDSNGSLYTAFNKATDATALLKLKLPNVDGAPATEVSSAGVTVRLNAKDNAGNWTSSANKKEVTVKIVSAKPNYPSRVKVLNPTNIKDAEKDKILTAIKEANKTNEAHPTFTKGTDGIITTYTDGTTYTVPYSDVITYNYVPKRKTINVGENPNWGDPKQYFTYEDGTAIGSDKTFLWKSSMNNIAPNDPDLTVGANKTLEVFAPNPEGGTPKTLTMTYDVVDNQPPKVKINGVELGDNVDQNPRFAIYRGAVFNPTFEVSDNSGKTTYLRASGIPSGVWFNKQGGNDVEKTDMANNTQYTLTTNNIVDNNNTLGEHTASVTVKDASRNTKTYQFKYVIVDIEAKNTPDTVPLNTKLVDPADTGHAKDSHNYVKVSDGNAQKTNGDDNYYTSGMSFTWSKDNTPITNKTLLSTPGVVNYTAVVTFPNNGEKYSKTVDGKTVTVYPPKKDTVSVTFKVKPTAPTVRPENNGDVTVTPANETNVNKVEVTYTPADTNRLEANGNVTKTTHAETTIRASKGANNKWSITQGAKDDGVSINESTGAITLKDYIVKDQTSVRATVSAQDVSSDPNQENAKNGDRTNPTIGLGNTLVGVGKEINLSLGLSDNGVGIDDSNIKVTLPTGATGLTYDSATKSIKGTLNTVTKQEVKVTVLDKNGNKAEKTISIAAVKPKAIYAIKDGTIDNVDTPSNFVEVPAGVTLTATWKDGNKPTTAAVGTTNKTVTVSLNGSSVDLTIPVTVYPKAVAKQSSFPTVSEKDHNPADGVKRTTPLPQGEDAANYIQFKNEKNENISKPDGVTVEWESKPVTTTPNPNQTGRVKITYNKIKITGTNGQETSAVEYVDVKVPVLHVTPKKTEVVATFGGNFEDASNNSAIYYNNNGNWTSSVWKSSSSKDYSEYATYVRNPEKHVTNYLGKVKDRIRAYVSDTKSPNWALYEEFDVTFTVKPLTPQVQPVTVGANSVTVNNVNSGTTVELYDMSNPAQPNKIGETTVAKEGEFNKKDKINVPLLAGKTLNPGAKIVAKVVYTSGTDRTESDSSSEVVIKHPKPANLTSTAKMNGDYEFTVPTDADKITFNIPTENDGTKTVTLTSADGWASTDTAVKKVGDKLVIPNGTLGTTNRTVNITETKGSGNAESASNNYDVTIPTHTAPTLSDVIVEAGATPTAEQISGAFTDITKRSLAAKSPLTAVPAGTIAEIPATLTYNDGSTEDVTITVKSKPIAPTITTTSGDKLRVTDRRISGTAMSNASKVTLHFQNNTEVTVTPNNGSWTYDLPEGTYLRQTEEATKAGYSATKVSVTQTVFGQTSDASEYGVVENRTFAGKAVKQIIGNAALTELNNHPERLLNYQENGQTTTLPNYLTATWKEAPDFTTVGTRTATLVISEKTGTNNQTRPVTEVTVPVTIYPTAVAKQAKFGQVKDKALLHGEDAANYVKFQASGTDVAKPSDVEVTWQTKPSTAEPGLDKTGVVKVTYHVTDENGAVKDEVQLVTIKTPVYHATVNNGGVYTTTFGTRFTSSTSASGGYLTPNQTSNVKYFWESRGYFNSIRNTMDADYLGKKIDKIQVLYPTDTGGVDYSDARSEILPIYFVVKPLTPTVEGVTSTATSLTVNNVNSGTTVELYDVTDTTKAPVKIGEKVVAKEGNYDKKDNISVPLTQGLAAGRKIIAKVVHTSGSDRTESDSSSEVVVKYPKPANLTSTAKMNGETEINIPTDADEVTFKISKGNEPASTLVAKKSEDWALSNGLLAKSSDNKWKFSSHEDGTYTITAVATAGNGETKSDETTTVITSNSHKVTKADIIKKPTDHFTGTDLYSATGITGVIDNGVTKTYQDADIKSVTSDGALPQLEPDTEKQVPVVITYNDGSKENTTVTLKVAPAAPNVTVNKQDGTTGDVTLTIKRHDDTNYSDGSVVTVPGIDGTFKVKDGTITIKNDQLKDTVQTGKVIVKEGTKLPAETDGDKTIPAKKVSSVVPKFGTPIRDESTGNVTISVTDQNGGALNNGTKVTLPGVKGDHTVQDGKVVISNDDLPDAEQSGKGSIEEAGKFPSQSTDNVTVPAKKVSSVVPKFGTPIRDESTGNVTISVTDQNGGALNNGTKV
ncbi:YSIRK-type signal peptide-containing protein, partial [Streptococcus sp.]